jgi:hypothetical protein
VNYESPSIGFRVQIVWFSIEDLRFYGLSCGVWILGFIVEVFNVVGFWDLGFKDFAFKLQNKNVT